MAASKLQTLWTKIRTALSGRAGRPPVRKHRPVSVIPFIQSVNDSRTGKVVGAEILMRLYDGKDYLSPAGMIAEMERDREINAITCGMMQDVSAVLPQILTDVPENFYISFNIYAPQLYDKRLLSAIHQLRRTFSPSIRIVLEIVERSLPEFDDELVDIMDTLREKNIQFAIDDFGHASSSLAYLEYAGFSFLKMDRSITSAHNGKLVYRRLINSLVLISQELDLHLVAEGIENEEQRELLTTCGVKDMQGYLFSKPVPLHKFREKLA